MASLRHLKETEIRRRHRIEDAEYDLVKKKVEAFEPYRNGFAFIPFLELFK